MAMLMSSFAAVMLAIVVAAYEGWSLLWARQWKAVVPCAVAAAAADARGFFVIERLGYTDAGTRFMTVGVNPMAIRVLEAGDLPELRSGAAGRRRRSRRRRPGAGRCPAFSPIGLILTMCTIFYFLVDVPDVQGVYVGWHVGKVAFVALTPRCADSRCRKAGRAAAGRAGR